MAADEHGIRLAMAPTVTRSPTPRSSSAAAAVLAALLAPGCAAEPDHAPDPGNADDTAECAFDVNDVSFLYPLPASADIDRLRPLADVLPQAVFAPLLARAGTSDDPRFAEAGFDQREAWRVVSARVDPCVAPLDPADKGCHVQIRLVAQPIVVDDAALMAADHAIHIVFDVPGAAGDVVPELVTDLQTLRGGVAGKPLGPHPLLVEQGLEGPFAAALDDFVSRWVDRGELTRVAVMATIDVANWRFAGGVVSGGKLVPAPLPNVVDDDGKPVFVQTFFGSTGVVGNFINRVSPKGTGKDNVNRIVDNDKMGSWLKIDAEGRRADANRAIRIDNPDRNGFLSVDCVSCHHASHALSRALASKLVDGPKFTFPQDGGHFVIDPDVNPNAFRAPAGTTTALRSESDGDHYDVRAFGYNADRVAINRRTVNESAKVAGELSRACRDLP